MSLTELKTVAESLKMPSFAGKQMAFWLYSKRVESIDEMTNISKQHRSRLNEGFEVGRTKPVTEQV